MTEHQKRQSWQRKIKHHLRPFQGLASENLVKILNEAEKEQSSLELFHNTMKFKQSFQKYLRFLKAKGFIKSRRDGWYCYYKITPKGKTFKQMLCYEGLDV